MRDLTNVLFIECRLSCGDFTGAILRKTDFTHADVSGIIYRNYQGLTWVPFWPFRHNLMLGRYLGIRGVDSCYGDPGFRRDALDQDFIDDRYNDALLLRDKRDIKSRWFGWFLNSTPIKTFRRVHWEELHRRIPRRFFFWLWSITDFGRSVASVFLFAAVLITIFGALYHYVLIPQHDVAFGATLAEQPNLPFRAWFAAAMGAATLGLTDLIHPRSLIGEAAMIGNVLSGLMMFGMMIAVLQNKFARRS